MDAPRRPADRRPAFAIPQFLPQLRKLRATDDTAGALAVGHADQRQQRRLARLLRGLGLLGGAGPGLLGDAAGRRAGGDAGPTRTATAQPAVLISVRPRLAVAFAVAGRSGLGTLLTAAFVVQVTPSVWTGLPNRSPHRDPQGTWLLILGELSCWTIFGVHKSDPRLIILGLTGVGRACSCSPGSAARPKSNRQQHPSAPDPDSRRHRPHHQRQQRRCRPGATTMANQSQTQPDRPGCDLPAPGQPRRGRPPRPHPGTGPAGHQGRQPGAFDRGRLPGTGRA